MLNPSKGNMYPFITHTWNTLKGKCPHDCSYCYMKRFGEQKPIRFDKSELNTDLGDGNFIFVGSSCDMWANDILKNWVIFTLNHCNKFNNTYLYQSKNPYRFKEFRNWIPPDSVLGTTIETNRFYSTHMGNTPEPLHRAFAMSWSQFKTMVTVEPIMDFDLDELIDIIKRCNPEWVNIGADSQGHNLPEPSGEKIQALIDNLTREGVDVKIKHNLKRLLPHPTKSALVVDENEGKSGS